MKGQRFAVVCLICGTLFGGCTGSAVSLGISALGNANSNPTRYAFLSRRIPLPHQVPPFAGGVSLRLAMVHDVLGQRYSKHGTAWYEARNAQAIDELSKFAPLDQSRWPVVDDIAVGLDRLGRPEESIPLLRKKMAEQQAAGIDDKDIYTTYANLGTMLIHANLAKAMRDDTVAVQRLDEGLQLIHQSINANPNAHFGREKWQAAIVEFLQATIAQPQLLTRYDCVGNWLDMSVEGMLNREENWASTGYGRPNFSRLTQRTDAFTDVPNFFEPATDLSDAKLWDDVKHIREYITTVGAEAGWDGVDVPSHREPVPFDEPVLGIVGMWRQGGGANPHFALALGEIMLRVGQRYIAWNAFERAAGMANRFSPDPQAQAFLKEHCAKRQADIEETLRFVATDIHDQRNVPWQYISLPPDAETIDRLREAFHAELNDGLAYQERYQQFEAAQIAAGMKTGDKMFFKDFDPGATKIASQVGLEETLLMVSQPDVEAYQSRHLIASATLGGGVGAMLVAVFMFLSNEIRRRAAARKDVVGI